MSRKPVSTLPQSEEAVKELLTTLGKGDPVRAQEAAEKLGVHREGDMYQRIGEMTRMLHQSLESFRSSLSAESITMHTTNIPDAAAKLEDIIRMTSEAAHTTLSSLEQQSDSLLETKAVLERGTEKISRDPSLSDETRAYLLQILSACEARIDHSLGTNLKVTTAQEYQDLTGQALRKVIKLVTHIEKNLISLIQIFGVDQISSSDAQQTDYNPSDEVDTGMLDQDDVDSVLKTFGF